MPTGILIRIYMILLLAGCSAPHHGMHDVSVGKTEEAFAALATEPKDHGGDDMPKPASRKDIQLEAFPASFEKNVSLDIDGSMHVADVFRVL